MRIPWIFHVGAAAEGLPLLAAVVWRRSLSSARKWILGWSAFHIVAEGGALSLALLDRNNHLLNYLVTPVANGIALWALSCWQASPLAALTLRLTVPLLGVTWLGMVLAIEDTRTFSLLAEPFAGLLLLGAAIYTLVSRTHREKRDIFQQDWVWVGAGMALYAGLAVALPPTAHVLMGLSPGLVIRAYEVKAVMNVVAFLAIARGVMCPTPVSPFGGSSSRAFSRWRSSSPVSSRPW